MNLSIKIAAKISEFNPAWDNFLPPNHHRQSRHLEAFEQSDIDDIENNYLQVFLKDKLIGLLYLQQFRFRHKHLNFKKNQTLLSSFIKIILPSQLRLLVCGHLFRINYQGFYFKNPSQQSHIFDAIKLFIKQHKNCRPIGIMIKDCNEVFIEQRCTLFGYQFFNGDVTMELTRRPHWLTFDDYLNDLKKDYFKRAKKILQAFQTIQTIELNATQIIHHAEDIERLYWNVVNKQIIKLGTVNARYFYQLKINLQQNFELHALYQNDKMVGFYTFIFYNHQMETHYIGLDYEVNKTAKLYFNILFAGIHKMIERRDDTLELGRTAREAKANIGAMPKQIFNYIKVSNPLVKMVVNYFLKKFNKAEDHSMVSRNPLK